MPTAAAQVRLAPEEYALVADIGGTNARFALAPLGEPGRAIHEKHLAVNAYDSLAHAAEAYLAEMAPTPRPVPGPTTAKVPTRSGALSGPPREVN